MENESKPRFRVNRIPEAGVKDPLSLFLTYSYRIMAYWQRLGELVYKNGVHTRNPSVFQTTWFFFYFFICFLRHDGDVDTLISSAVMI